MNKSNTKQIKNLVSVLIFSSQLINFIPVFSQGYQQPILPQDESYDNVLQQDNNFRDPGIGTATRPLKGRVVVAPAGSKFEATLATTLSSGINRVGDIVSATVSAPLVVGADVLIPAGSQAIGQVVNAVPEED